MNVPCVWPKTSSLLLIVGLVVLGLTTGAGRTVVMAQAAPDDLIQTYLPMVGKYFPVMYAGVFIPMVSPSTWNGEMDAFVNLAGKQHAVYLVSSGFGCPWADNVSTFSSFLAHIHAAGAVPLITWMPMDCSNNGTGNVNSLGLPDILSGAWDIYIEKWATDINSLGYPVFVRWGHEMNIPTYSWGAQHAFGSNGRTDYNLVSDDPCGLTDCFVGGDPTVYDGPERYVAAYQYVHDLVAPLAPNIIWVWNPNAQNHPPPDAAPWNQYNNYYPGDAYVDWIALDGYNWGDQSGNGYGRWLSFDEMFGPELNDLAQRHPTKMQMIAEFAAVEDEVDASRKPGFIRDAFQAARGYPSLKVVIWVQDNDFYDELHYGGRVQVDFRVNSSTASLQAYRDAVSTYSSEAPAP